MKRQWFTLYSWKGLFAGAVFAVIIGVIMGLIVNLQPARHEEGRVFRLEEVILGTPVTPPAAGTVWNPADRLTSKKTYATNDPLALRVVSREPAEQPIVLTARLLREDGSLEALEPSTITVLGGTGGYCCWHIDQQGKYKLQIFSGEQAPFVLPVTVTAPQRNASPLRLQ